MEEERAACAFLPKRKKKVGKEFKCETNFRTVRRVTDDDLNKLIEGW